jgi:MFS family permease
VVIPFVAASPLATSLLMSGRDSLALLAAGRALSGVCSGVVFGSATAWVQELSPDPAVSARRAAIALSAGFGAGPAVASTLAEWVPQPLVLPYLPHVLIGLAAIGVIWRAPETVTRRVAGVAGQGPRLWPPRTVRSGRFWRAVAPPGPWVFGSLALAFVVLPRESAGAGHLSVGFAGLIASVTVASGIAIQPLARWIEARLSLAGCWRPEASAGSSSASRNRGSRSSMRSWPTAGPRPAPRASIPCCHFSPHGRHTHLERSHGESGTTARLLLFTADGLIWAASTVVLDASRRSSSRGGQGPRSPVPCTGRSSLRPDSWP